MWYKFLGLPSGHAARLCAVTRAFPLGPAHGLTRFMWKGHLPSLLSLLPRGPRSARSPPAPQCPRPGQGRARAVHG